MVRQSHLSSSIQPRVDILVLHLEVKSLGKALYVMFANYDELSYVWGNTIRKTAQKHSQGLSHTYTQLFWV